MTTSICTKHANELIMVDDVLDPQGIAVVSLGLINQDGSNTFPGRTLTPDQAEGLAACLAQSAAAARATAGLAPAPLGGDQAREDTLKAIAVAVPLTGTDAVLADEEAGATAPQPPQKPAPSRLPKATAKPRAPAKRRSSKDE
jgi:hypothetical protein